MPDSAPRGTAGTSPTVAELAWAGILGGNIDSTSDKLGGELHPSYLFATFLHLLGLRPERCD